MASVISNGNIVLKILLGLQLYIFCGKVYSFSCFIRIVPKKMFYKICIVVSTIKYKKHINQKLILHFIRRS